MYITLKCITINSLVFIIQKVATKFLINGMYKGNFMEGSSEVWIYNF